MKILGFISEFWKQNKVEYILSCVAFSLAGFIVYAMTEPNYKIENYLIILPLFFIGIYVLALCLGFLIYYDKQK